MNDTDICGISSEPSKQDDIEVLKALDLQFLDRLEPDLQTLLVEIMNLAWSLNDATANRRPKVDGHKFHRTLLRLGYRLVQFCPLGGTRPYDNLENAIHLGLTAFVVTFLVGLDRKIVYMPLLSELVRSATLQALLDEEENEVLLWLLFVSGTSIFKSTDDEWLLPKIKQKMAILDLRTWEDVGRMLARYPWVNVAHDKTGLFLHQNCQKKTNEAKTKSQKK